MRIKNYDYDTVSKLNNPLRDFNTVLEFVENCFEVLESDDLIISYRLNDINCFYDKDENCLCFFYETYCFYEMYGDFLKSSKLFHKENKQNDDWLFYFKELKELFLNYKLKEKLDKELKENKVNKKKVSKI